MNLKDIKVGQTIISKISITEEDMQVLSDHMEQVRVPVAKLKKIADKVENSPKEVYRVILAEEAKPIIELVKGKSPKSKRYSSWTTSIKSIQHFINPQQFLYGVVYKLSSPTKPLIDLYELSKNKEFKKTFVEKYGQKHFDMIKQEKEVILVGDRKLNKKNIHSLIYKHKIVPISRIKDINKFFRGDI